MIYLNPKSTAAEIAEYYKLSDYDLETLNKKKNEVQMRRDADVLSEDIRYYTKECLFYQNAPHTHNTGFSGRVHVGPDRDDKDDFIAWIRARWNEKVYNYARFLIEAGIVVKKKNKVEEEQRIINKDYLCGNINIPLRYDIYCGTHYLSYVIEIELTDSIKRIMRTFAKAAGLTSDFTSKQIVRSTKLILEAINSGNPALAYALS